MAIALPDNFARGLPCCLPLSHVAEIVAALGGADVSKHTQRKRAARNLHSLGNQMTPYGPIIEMLKVNVVDVPMINPYAFLNYMTAHLPEYGDLLKRCRMESDKLTLLLYVDAARAGNVLRPDSGRSLECFYWSIAELPDWFRSRSQGWLPCMVVRTDTVKELVWGLPELMKEIVRVFAKHPDGWSMKTVGTNIHCSTGDFHFKVDSVKVLCDELAIKQIWSLKGAAGTKPCFCCKNIVSRGFEGHDYIKSFRTAKPCDFDLHDDQSFMDMTTYLKNFLDSVPTRKAADEMQKYLGINFEPGTLLWDPEFTNDVIKPITGTRWDWMHVLMASGGVAQYTANKFIYELKHAHNISLDDLDRFNGTIIWPKTCPKPLTKKFFKDRFVDDVGGHLRCFASEMSSVLAVLELFADMVLEPQIAMVEQCMCLKAMRKIVCILNLDSKAVGKVNELRAAIVIHFKLFTRLNPECVKPKLHFLWHVPDQIERDNSNLSCFGPERRHRLVKGIGSHVFNQMESHILAKLLNDCYANIVDRRETLQQTYLMPRRPWVVPDSFRNVFVNLHMVYVSEKVHCGVGYIMARDLIQTTMNVGCVKFFMEVEMMNGEKKHFVQMGVYIQPNPDNPSWSASGYGDVLEPIDNVQRVLPYVKSQGGVLPIFPRLG
ncbi:unnamed protein product [Prorocentrum cordatum]|uniref:Uncharacterized protein n=1 Tax=Prorocentrum cordatum TaxID=2364126 RepID=A0ABN9V159_9DINO|nr:unnamed protein product [Polarella glacialis]